MNFCWRRRWSLFPTLLFQLACEYLVSARVMRLGQDPLFCVAQPREQTQFETYKRRMTG